MGHTIGFDNEKYLKEQTTAIMERVKQFDNKLYLEFGGKLLFDMHASRVLPGFDPNVKMRLLQQLKEKVEVIICIYAGDIERKKMRGDFGITYDVDAQKLIDDLAEWEIKVRAVLVTRYEGQPSTKMFINKLERRGIKVYKHHYTKGYPHDVDVIVSDEGYGKNDYIKTEKPIVVVTAPGPGSGKLGTCLSQLYHDHKHGIKSGYAKFETFPIWNLPLKHPVNIAYEAATADLKDVNLIDHFHLEAYNEKSVNYNRDLEAFPLLRRILEKITESESPYKSPTDMGVNRAGFGIVENEVVKEAATQEIIRRCFHSAREYAIGLGDKETLQRSEQLMIDQNISEDYRDVVSPAREAAIEGEQKGKGSEGIYCGAALKLRDGTIIQGKNSSLMHVASSLILNATKHLADIPDNMFLLPSAITKSLGIFKKDVLNSKMLSLDLEETLTALCISSISNPAAQLAVEKLKELRGCEVHFTHIPSPGDEGGLRKLGLNVTSDPNFASKKLFVS